MLEELTLEALQERVRYGVIDPYTALVLRRLQGQHSVDLEIPGTVEHEAEYAARRAAEDVVIRQKREAREQRLQECREAVMRAGGPEVLQQALWRRQVMQQAAARAQQQRRWQQTNASNGSYTASGTGNTFFYTTT